nr:C13 family peptidase [Candidatus Sigynarchaeota archaeon]
MRMNTIGKYAIGFCLVAAFFIGVVAQQASPPSEFADSLARESVATPAQGPTLSAYHQTYALLVAGYAGPPDAYLLDYFMHACDTAYLNLIDFGVLEMNIAYLHPYEYRPITYYPDGTPIIGPITVVTSPAGITGTTPVHHTELPTVLSNPWKGAPPDSDDLVLLFMCDHGMGSTGMCFDTNYDGIYNSYEVITPDDIYTKLETSAYYHHATAILIVDCCYSGMFLPPFASDEDTIVISSSTADNRAHGYYTDAEPYKSFLTWFVEELDRGKTYSQAYTFAEGNVHTLINPAETAKGELPSSLQDPQQQIPATLTYVWNDMTFDSKCPAWTITDNSLGYTQESAGTLTILNAVTNGERNVEIYGVYRYAASGQMGHVTINDYPASMSGGGPEMYYDATSLAPGEARSYTVSAGGVQYQATQDGIDEARTRSDGVTVRLVNPSDAADVISQPVSLTVYYQFYTDAKPIPIWDDMAFVLAGVVISGIFIRKQLKACKP